MRLDKMLSELGLATRSESAKAARSGGISVNGVRVSKCDMHVDPLSDEVIFLGKKVVYKKFIYIILNKPDGYISATEDGKGPTVLDLLPDDITRRGVFPCGRLDKNTHGLMLITNDGELAHLLLSPARHVTKSYFFRCQSELGEDEVKRICNGLDIGEKRLTLPATLELNEDGMSGVITITEGKYHQIKRMFEAVDNKIVYLKRISFGNLTLDNDLEEGQWRELTDDEIEGLNSVRG